MHMGQETWQDPTYVKVPYLRVLASPAQGCNPEWCSCVMSGRGRASQCLGEHRHMGMCGPWHLSAQSLTWAAEEPLLTSTHKINQQHSISGWNTRLWGCRDSGIDQCRRSPGGYLQTSHPCQGGQPPRVAALQSPPPSKGNCSSWHRETLPTHSSSSGSSKQLLVFKAQQEWVWSWGAAVQNASQQEQALGAIHKFTVDNN